MNSKERDAATHWEVHIVAAGSHDQEAIDALQRVVMADPWSSESIAAELAQPGSLAWVARRGGALIGFLLVRKIPGQLEVMAMGVAPDERRCGTGRRLLERATAAAREAGRAELVLELRASNAAGRALYEEAGFVVAGRRPRYYPGGEDALLMNLQLE